MRGTDWDKILAAYQHRSGTQNEFCSEHGIKLVTLQYHLSKSKQKKRKQPAFVPLEVEPAPEPSVVFEFPNGLKLTVNAQ